MLEQIQELVKDAELVLVGIGEEFDTKKAGKEQVIQAYQTLADMLKNKEYFLVTLQTDELIYASDLDKERIVAPCGSDVTGNVVTNQNYDESGYLPQWEKYTKWLSHSLNKKLCVLELGVGFKYPSVIRFPFEKTAYFNQKSSFVRVHSEFAQLPPEIKDKSIVMKALPVQVLNEN